MATWNPRANDVFLQALALPSVDERQVYLKEACAGDAALRAEVEALLDASDKAGSFLKSPAPHLGATIDAPMPAERLGTMIGPYKLLQQIGEGGMGTVYMAEQTEPVKRKVALKVIKPGMDSRQVIARFEAERQALSMMDHVNIARVFDGGATENGRPYFVMELVHGVPITKYCDDNHLTPRQRLELFVPVCQAIQHAHQKGIIHRDIKPSNVMITLYDGKPIPKVIDFGVAKAIEHKLTDRTLFTQFGTMVGTLEYMSPEQAEMSALGVDTRSDIYSLGVLLYELLTGSTPLSSKRMKEAAYAEILRMIKEEEPPKPSTRLSESGEALASISVLRHTEPAKLSKLMRGELDWIVMKTLEKDRSRRYETANAFAADVQRYLADETVQACPQSLWYRVQKAARRNRRLLLASGVLGLAATAAIGSLGWAIGDRMERRAATDRGAAVALGEANDALAGGRRAEARIALNRADSYLVGAGDRPLAIQAENLHRDLTLLDQLDGVRVRSFGRSADNVRFLDYSKADPAYAEAFRTAGLDLNGIDAGMVADRFVGRAGLAELASALDDWAAAQRKLKDEERAKHLLAVAQRIDPDPWRNRVRDTLDRGDVAALKALAGSPELAGQSAGAVHCLAKALVDVQAFPEAAAVLTAAQPRHAGDFWVNYTLGYALGQYKSGRDSTPYFMAAAALRPNDDIAAVQVGHFLGVQKNPATHVWWDQIAQRNPTSASMHRLRGKSLIELGDQAGAIAAWKEALRLQPGDGDSRISLAEILAKTGAYEEAVQALDEHSRRLPPGATFSNSSLGLVIIQLSRIAELLANGPDPRVWNPQIALRAAARVVELDSKNNSTNFLFGMALYRAGKYREALGVFSRPFVMRFRPIEQGYYAAMARAKLGEFEEARKRLTAAVLSTERECASDEKMRRLATEASAVVGVALPPSLRDGPESPVPAPTPIAPGNWTLLDRAQIDPEKKTWKTTFTWEPVPKATRYHIQVRTAMFSVDEPNLANPIGPANEQIVDNSLLRLANCVHGPRLIYHRAGGFFPQVCRWRVRALVEDAWTPWSREQTLWVMPPAIGEPKRKY